MTATDQAGDEQLRQGRPFQLCIFDERRGEQEGQEQDKILGYYPAQVPLQEQGSVVGLAQALLTLHQHLPAGVALPVPFRKTAASCKSRLLLEQRAISSFVVLQDAPCEAVHTEHSRWVVHCCEPHIWMLLVSGKPTLRRTWKYCSRKPHLYAICDNLINATDGGEGLA